MIAEGRKLNSDPSVQAIVDEIVTLKGEVIQAVAAALGR